VNEPTTNIEGFTITGGNANDNHNESGGGMYNSAGNPTVTNCIFTGNWASWDALGGGGGMANYYSNPAITNCTFSDNAASCWLGAGGGGMYNEYSDPMLINCTFTGNSAASGLGGGMLNTWSNPTLSNCTFTENYASHRGGAIHNDYGSFQPVLRGCRFSGNISALDGGGIYNVSCDSITLTGCIFKKNLAGRDGGGIYNDHANSILTNCLFGGNLATEGGGVYHAGYHPRNTMTLANCTFSSNCSLNGNSVACDSYQQEYPSILEITNCIMWDGPDGIWNNDGSAIRVNYSDIEGGEASCYDPCDMIEWGVGNIDVDPYFVEVGKWVDANDSNTVVEPNGPNAVWVDGDYHLKSEGWRLDMNFDSPRWRYDYVTSRCIDAGNPGSPLGGELLTIPGDPGHIWGENLRINMGAYGGTPQASMPPYDWALLADITNDGIVDGRDYAHQATDWLMNGTEQPGDFDRNGIVDTNDVGLFVDDWLKTTSWY
jgi:predicted outer membrane repeat protein